MGKYFFSPEALDDLDAICGYIAESNPEAADRAVEAAYRTCKTIALHPELGPQRRFADNDPPDIRFFVLTDFPNYLLFYRTTVEGVEIIRILHGAQEIDDLFGK